MVDLEKMSARDAAEWIHAEIKRVGEKFQPRQATITVDILAEGIQFLRDAKAFATKPRVVKSKTYLHQVIESESKSGFSVVYDIYLTDKKIHTFAVGYDRKPADKVKVLPGVVMLDSKGNKFISAMIYGILPNLVEYEISFFLYQAAATNLDKIQAEINSWSFEKEATGLVDRYTEKSKGSDKDKNHTTKKLAKTLSMNPALLGIEPKELLYIMDLMHKYESQLFNLSTYIKSNVHDQIHWTEETVKEAQALASAEMVDKI